MGRQNCKREWHRRGLAALVGLFLSGVVGAAGEEWVLTADPEATRIVFTLGAILHTVEGSARLESGSVRFDPATGTASGSFVVHAATLGTGNARRDRDMHRKVLESESHPTMTFTVDALGGGLQPQGEFEVEIVGRLEIHGVSHPLPITARGRFEGDRLEATTSFVVPYVEWGMKDPSKFLLRVAKEVEVEIELTASVRPASDG